MDNPEDSTVVAEGRGLGHLVPRFACASASCEYLCRVFEKQALFSQNAGLFLHKADMPLILKWFKLKGFPLNGFP